VARISYIEEKDHPELAAEISKIKGGRGALINIYKLLLHTPTVCMNWFEHIGAIRWKTKLTPRLREIAIVRVAQSAKYAYALQQHIPAIAALAYVDAMIAGPEVPDDVFNAVRESHSEREVVELTVLVGTYLMHNRVFTALKVDLEPKKP
jgi:4-carboxymuconolactone decarboxylase